MDTEHAASPRQTPACTEHREGGPPGLQMETANGHSEPARGLGDGCGATSRGRAGPGGGGDTELLTCFCPPASILMAIAFIILWALVSRSVGIPRHSFFSYDEVSGLIHLDEVPELRLNVKGGDLETPGAPIILWPCSPQIHEMFEMQNGLIKLSVEERLCLNAAGGAGAGNAVVLFPCEQDGVRAPNEDFEVRSDGRIALKQSPDLCLNVEGGTIELGAKIVMWPCSDGEVSNELFSLNDGMIQVKQQPSFHFNVQGELAPGSPIILWQCGAGVHEALEFTADSRIRLKMHQQFCLNAEGGLAPGHRIVAWPCSETAESNELFKYDPDLKIIYSLENPELGFNAAGGEMQAGDGIVLWPFEAIDPLDEEWTEEL